MLRSKPREKMDKALIFVYKVQRKIRRELRKRFAPALTRWDLACLRSATGNLDFKSTMLDYTELQCGIWPDDWNSAFTEEELTALLSKADQVASNKFNLLGSGECDLGDAVDWHRDIKTGYQWPCDTHHLCIAWDAVPPGTDIKMPWELSRCQHFVTMGIAARVSGDGKYYRAFKAQLKSWIASNPCGYGVNWVCAMDVAIRAVNWLAAISLFKGEIERDEDVQFVDECVQSLWLHGRHIMRNLEWQGPQSPSLANHFLADISGIFAIGLLFRETRQGRAWLKFSRKWLEIEAIRQVFPDGANFETSTSYHRLSTEMFLWAALMGQQAGNDFSPDYNKRLEGMAGFIKAYTSPSGKAAQFGDNDGGRFLTVGIEDPSDHRYLLSGAEGGFGNISNRMLFGGGCGSGSHVQELANGVAFKDGGYWFAGTKRSWIGVRAGVVSHAGAHAHADQLSFVLTVDGRDIVVDPGTGVYSADPDKRNTYRSSSAHNGPQINGGETNRFASGMAGLFRMQDDTQTVVKVWEVDANHVSFQAEHRGYARGTENKICNRTMKMLPEVLEVTDSITSVRKGDRIDWSLRFAPGVAVEKQDDGVVVMHDGVAVTIKFDSTVQFEVLKNLHSPSYGLEVEARSVRVWATVDADGLYEHKMSLSW